MIAWNSDKVISCFKDVENDMAIQIIDNIKETIRNKNMDKIILDNQREINKLTKVLGVLPVYLYIIKNKAVESMLY